MSSSKAAGSVNKAGTGNGHHGRQSRSGSRVRGRDAAARKVHVDRKINRNPNAQVNATPHLTCYYTNSDSLLNKRAELCTVISLNAPDIICISEVLPKRTLTKVQESELQITGYDLCTNLTVAKRGVIIYTAHHLKAAPVEKLSKYTFHENCWVEINLRGKDKLLVGCIYRSPNTSDKENNENLFKILISASNMKKYSHKLICGDFNIPGICWSDGTSSGNENSLSFKFLECIRESFFHQHVTENTHYPPGRNPSTIDLIFTNEEGMITNLAHETPLGHSHHSSLLFEFNCYTEPSVRAEPTIQYTKGDYDSMRTFVNTF
jgi:hypothetical protein